MTQPILKSELEMLKGHFARLKLTSILDLFEADSNRFETMSVRLDDLLFDYSKNHLDKAALAGLVSIARKAHLEKTRDAMFAGEKINVTEGRAVLHSALRNLSDQPVMVDGHDVMADIRGVLVRMASFTDAIRTGAYKPSGKKITDVINIGIGGSDLGPRMVTEALAPFCDGPSVHFVANVDGADLADTLKSLKPQSTLFIIASKTFTTQETMANARSAFSWMQAGVGETAADHFAALSTNLDATARFGIPEERTFGFWDWVGGRYSVWSAIGLSVMMAVGKENFQKLLQGAHKADAHFGTAPLEQNIPVLMALIGIWHRNVCNYPAHALLPYDNRLANLPRWLQQLDMESNGKSVATSGAAVATATGPVVFGEPGTNGQHAFYQLIHQGTDIIPCDFLVAAKGHEPHLDHQHKLLVANCIAQSQALMRGRTLEEAGGNPHRVFSGNRPSNTFLYRQLDPDTLGMLLAFYEHKIFVQGVIWGINSFDQWGVELGKELCKKLEPMVEGEDGAQFEDDSTRGLVETFHFLRG